VQLQEETEAFKRLAAGNLQRQYDLIRDLVIALNSLDEPQNGIDVGMVCWLHSYATVGLVSRPGLFRDHLVEIRGSPHRPPPTNQIADRMAQFISDVRSKWKTENPFLIAAFALWNLTWIHPFEDGNGRTARAFAYFILCLSYRGWLPGRDTIIEKMQTHEGQYNEALRVADESFAKGELNLMPLALLIGRHTKQQLKRDK
jgi:Fic family protein